VQVKLLLLSLFTQIEYQLPNMVMGILLRENVRQAVHVGISANQILQACLSRHDCSFQREPSTTSITLISFSLARSISSSRPTHTRR
jgi:hypothetical protein